MTKSIYQRRMELYRETQEMLKTLSSDEISFDNFMKLKEKEDDSFKRWEFYNNYIKACNKLKINDNNENNNNLARKR